MDFILLLESKENMKRNEFGDRSRVQIMKNFIG